MKFKNLILCIFIFLSTTSFIELDSLLIDHIEDNLVDGNEKKAKPKKKKSNPSGIKKLKIKLRKKLFQKTVKRSTKHTIKHKKQNKKRKYTPKNNRFQRKNFHSVKKHKQKKVKRKNIWNDNR